MNLEKVIKVTQSQYDILASGGRVGDYVGLDDNYVYLIEDTNTYITSNGGIIDGGNLTIEGNAQLNVEFGNGVHIYNSNHDTIAAVGADMFGNEIIYNSSNNYQPLFANDSYALIYSDNSDYLSDFTFHTTSLRIADASGTSNTLSISAEEYMIYHQTSGSTYYAQLPNASGTLALTSDIPSVSLTTTAGSESITVNSNTLNVVTRDTAQTVPGIKTFSNGIITSSVAPSSGTLSLGLTGQSVQTNGNLIPEQNNYRDLGNVNRYWKDLYLSGNAYIQTISSTGQLTTKVANADKYYFTASQFMPATNNSLDLGRSDVKWKDAYIAGNLSDGTNSITVANIQEKVQVKRYI